MGLPLALGASPPPPSPAAILQDLRGFRQMGSVLFVAAHPDDENTLLLAYLARGRDYRTAYLSLTRGDGGQNVLGPEFGAKLGVARTQELLAARHIDGARQFFTRAIDFGFSKDYRETLRIWDREAIVADIVRVIRTFRPDVVITRFAPWPTGTHGHHTASAVLALEAFKRAGDPKAFPDQLRLLAPWQPTRILWNGRGGSGATNVVRLEIEGDDPVLGLPFAEVAGRSRSMHKTQGFGGFGGFRGGGGVRTESFQLLAGVPATHDILDGVDTTWARVPGGAELGALAGDAIAQFKPEDPAASVPLLLKLHRRLAALRSQDPVVAEKRVQLDRILQACLGLRVDTVIAHADVVPGERLTLRHSALEQSSVAVRWVATRYPSLHREVGGAIALRPGQASTREALETVPPSTPLSQPYWLREDGSPGLFRVDDPSLIGRPESPPALPLEHVFDVGGQTLLVPDAPTAITTEAQGGETRRALEVISPVALGFETEVELFAPGASRAVTVEVTAARDAVGGTLRLQVPQGWQVAPETQPFQLPTAGNRARFRFTVTAPTQPATGKLRAGARVGGVWYQNEHLELRYPHIPPQLLQPAARLEAVCLDLAIRGHTIGYVPGAGDDVPQALRQMGYTVTTLAGADLTPERLRGLDAVVVGVRAFNVRKDLTPHLGALFAYVEAGGTLVEQYNRPDRSGVNQVTPFDLRLSQERVTDEEAPVTFLAPDHPALNTPNKITPADFAGWVQ